MCSACAMTAVAAASGTRAWLAAHRMAWLTPRRLRMITIGLAVAALVVSSVRFSGSTQPPAHHVAPAAASATR
jgi:hypothetical protein